MVRAVDNEKALPESGANALESLSLKLDSHGFPLQPQPTKDPKDPLNWTMWLKFVALFQVSFLSFLGTFTQATITPALGPLSKSMHISVVEASYNVTVSILLAGFGPLIWSPISNVCGRRPVFIYVTVLGIVAFCAAAAAPTWAGILTARAFAGLGVSAGMGIGASVVADLFFLHERGRYMGLYVNFVTNGSHFAVIIGGYTALNPNLGWRWCYWLSAIVLAFSWLMVLFCFPETLYHRNNATGETLERPKSSWFKLFSAGFPGVGCLRLKDFWNVFYMLKYPSVLLPALYYTLTFGFGNVLFAVTAAANFGVTGIYHFNSGQVGLALGLPTAIGTLIGEIFGGPVNDYLLFLHRKRHGTAKPEAQLQAIWPGAFLTPAGIIFQGVTLQKETHWMGPFMGTAITSVGAQIISTNVFTYVTDCYKPQSAELSTLLNWGRQVFSFTLGFYMIPFAERTTFGAAWGTVAAIHAVSFATIIALMWRGEDWRRRMDEPNFHKEI